VRAEVLEVRRCAVIGSPVAHSLSPALHRAAYAALGLSWRYDAEEVTAQRLPGFLAGLGPQWRGLSVTTPLKRVMGERCTQVDGAAAQLAGVNTVLLEPGGERIGVNTDVAGMVTALRAGGVADVETVTIMGGGATATSALFAAAELGARTVTVVVRTPSRARGLRQLGDRLSLRVAVAELSQAPQLAADVLISTIPAAAQPPFARQLAAGARTVLDVVYAPWDTPLLLAAEASGRTTVHGFEMLLHQAARQVELMTGVATAPVSVMRAAGLSAAVYDGP
jgi:shikimate dehydrogenase